ncbi:MAG: site-2 protease family protein [Ardenticatenaceae bacterium]|nr:site-2 protease family protein [Ardenticatenaceae bacterium]
MGIFQLFMQNGRFDVAAYAAFLLVGFFAFAYHEFAHALMADRLGDDTPRRYGRITLNPFPHIDRLGFILLAIFGFGWATTPVNPGNFRGNPRLGHALVAVVGPLANLLMAFMFALLGRGLIMAFGEIPQIFVNLVFWGVWLNCILLFFNLLPVPPLDGFTILLGILPGELAYRLMPLRQYGMIIFLAVFFLLPAININVVGNVFGWAFQLASLLMGPGIL